MPTYEYACRSCGEHLEVVQSFKDEPLRVCPGCGGSLRKVFGSIGIAFKGSGFYKTDSRAEAKKANGEAKSAERSESRAESKKEGGSTSSDSSATTKAAAAS